MLEKTILRVEDDKNGLVSACFVFLRIVESMYVENFTSLSSH